MTQLPPSVRDHLLKVIKPKFDAYFQFTSSSSGRSSRAVRDPGGQPVFIYPNESMCADLTVLGLLFVEFFEAVSEHKGKRGAAKVSSFIAADLFRLQSFYDIVDKGEFWDSPGGKLRRVPTAQAVPDRLDDIARTLRDCFAHGYWRYDDLSALDYWTRQGWDTSNADPAFGIDSRPANNWVAYLVDAVPPWTPACFWSMKDLRIIVTPYIELRFHLHRFFNYVLNGSTTNVFDE